MTGKNNNTPILLPPNIRPNPGHPQIEQTRSHLRPRRRGISICTTVSLARARQKRTPSTVAREKGREYESNFTHDELHIVPPGLDQQRRIVEQAGSETDKVLERSGIVAHLNEVSIQQRAEGKLTRATATIP
jgi:hypothetical protein